MKAVIIRKFAFRLWVVLSVPLAAWFVIASSEEGDAIMLRFLVGAFPVVILGGVIGGMAWVVSAFFEDD